MHQRGHRQGDPLSPMFFILVMDVLNSLINRASDEGLLQPLSTQGIQHQVSLYADDAVLFLRPVAEDFNLIKQILQLFGEVSGLRTNILKCSVSPIHCSEEDLVIIRDFLPCEVKLCLCTYLGLPLTVRRPSKVVLQPLVDKVSDNLPGWKASLLNRAGRLILVRMVLAATLIYQMIAMDLPKWVFKAIDKRQRGFLWTGQEQAKGGNCLVSWQRVRRPLYFGGLGIHDLVTLSWAHRMRWLWLQKTEPSCPWAGFQIQVHPNAKAMFAMATATLVGNGINTKFWSDRWLHSHTIADLVPHLTSLISRRAISHRTVSQALENRRLGAWYQGNLFGEDN